MNNDFLFDRVCREWRRESHIWISLGCDAVICHSPQFSLSHNNEISLSADIQINSNYDDNLKNLNLLVGFNVSIKFVTYITFDTRHTVRKKQQLGKPLLTHVTLTYLKFLGCSQSGINFRDWLRSINSHCIIYSWRKENGNKFKPGALPIKVITPCGADLDGDRPKRI